MIFVGSDSRFEFRPVSTPESTPDTYPGNVRRVSGALLIPTKF